MNSPIVSSWSSTRRRIRRLGELKASEWLVLFQLVPAASAIRLASHQARVERLARWLGESEAAARFVPLACGRLSDSELFRLADWATRLTKGEQRCLQRSLVLHWLLARRGRAPVLEVGVALRDGQLLSHAWVVVGGQPLGDTPATLTQFRTILRIGVG